MAVACAPVAKRVTVSGPNYRRILRQLFEETPMQRMLSVIGVLCFSFLLAWSQTTTTPAAKPRPAGPIAIIDTTVGKMKCELFPDKAPIGVANFIGLANGTKDWKNPISGAKKHGVPLYDGTIFHRVIPEFMIQGGDPKGTGEGDPGYEFKNETS